MLNRLKSIIIESAKSAVVIAEKTLGSNKGKQKKQMAIEYVLKHIPLPSFIKPLISLFLSSFIDDAIEFAVECMEEK